MNEFDRIKNYFAPLAGAEGLNLLDDAACYQPSPGLDIVVTTDMMVENVHFPADCPYEYVAQRLMRTNLSDLAAKGAQPRGYLLSLAWPHNISTDNIAEFVQGLKAVQEEFGLQLWGGDTVSTLGPLTVSATLIGTVIQGMMVSRSRAMPGDDLWVSGTIGDGFLGLQHVQGQMGCALSAEQASNLFRAFYYPEPRMKLGISLAGIASAALDISDGLIADAVHMAKASQIQLQIDLDSVPLSSAACQWLMRDGNDQESIKHLVTGGDDYELLFAAPATARGEVLAIGQQCATRVTRIGHCHSGQGVTVKDCNGNAVTFNQTGYQHF